MKASEPGRQILRSQNSCRVFLEEVRKATFWSILDLHLSRNREDRWGTTDDFTNSFLHFSLSSTALWDLANSRPGHSLMLSSHLFFCLPCLLPPFTVPYKMVVGRLDEQETCPHHCSWRLFTMVSRFSCGLPACSILAQTLSLVTWFLHEGSFYCSALSEKLTLIPAFTRSYRGKIMWKNLTDNNFFFSEGHIKVRARTKSK